MNVESLRVFLRDFRQGSSGKAVMLREEFSDLSAEAAAKFLQDHWANTRGLTLRNVPNGSLLLTFNQSQLNHLIQDPKGDSDTRSLQEFLFSLSQDDAKSVPSKTELQKLNAKEAAYFLYQHFFNPRKIGFVADNFPDGSMLVTLSAKQLVHLFLNPTKGWRKICTGISLAWVAKHPLKVLRWMLKHEKNRSLSRTNTRRTCFLNF